MLFKNFYLLCLLYGLLRIWHGRWLSTTDPQNCLADAKLGSLEVFNKLDNGSLFSSLLT